jgi:hypothetical protein
MVETRDADSNSLFYAHKEGPEKPFIKVAGLQFAEPLSLRI